MKNSNDRFALIHNYDEYNSKIDNSTYLNHPMTFETMFNSIQSKLQSRFKSLWRYYTIISQHCAKWLTNYYYRQIIDVLCCEIALSFLYTSEYLMHSKYRISMNQVFFEYKPIDSHVRMPPLEPSDKRGPILINTVSDLKDTEQFKSGVVHINQSIPGTYIRHYTKYANDLQSSNIRNSYSCVFEDKSNKSAKYFLPAWLYPIPVLIYNNQRIKTKQKFIKLYEDIKEYKEPLPYDILIRYKLEHLFHHRQIDNLCEKYTSWKKYQWPYPIYEKSNEAFPNENMLFDSSFFSLFKNNSIIDLVPFIDLFIYYTWILDEFYGKSTITTQEFLDYLNECLTEFNTLKSDYTDLFASWLRKSDSLKNISDAALAYLSNSSYFNTFYCHDKLLSNYDQVINSKESVDKTFKDSIQRFLF